MGNFLVLGKNRNKAKINPIEPEDFLKNYLGGVNQTAGTIA
jgi:hypothetical protein